MKNRSASIKIKSKSSFPKSTDLVSCSTANLGRFFKDNGFPSLNKVVNQIVKIEKQKTSK